MDQQQPESSNETALFESPSFVFSLAIARALPEITEQGEYQPVEANYADEIVRFKGEDGRTMIVVHSKERGLAQLQASTEAP